MNAVFVIAIAVVLSLYGLINYYIGLRGWQTIGSSVPFLSAKVYWIIFWLIALSYIIARSISKFLHLYISTALTIVGAYWIAAMVYFLLFLILIDCIRLINRWTGFLPTWIKSSPFYIGMVVVTLVLVILVYGAINARNPRVTHYDISIDKQAGAIDSLHAVMISDIHLGTIIHKDRLKKIVEKVNALKPEIVFLVGDMIDEDVGPFIEQKMSDELRLLKPKYGVYAVLGNHEYYAGHLDEIVKQLQDSGVKLLRDQYLKVGDGFYVVGREDKALEREMHKYRGKLIDIMQGIDKTKPIINLDHEPFGLQEAELEGVDLQFSGHTHRGQMFPGSLITRKIFEKDWGYLQKGNFNLIVSSGVGTWGPPVRIGTNPEVVDVLIDFKVQK